jgi:hypothetical protein
MSPTTKYDNLVAYYLHCVVYQSLWNMILYLFEVGN